MFVPRGGAAGEGGGAGQGSGGALSMRAVEGAMGLQRGDYLPHAGLYNSAS
jgi:hypothetical protein